MATEQNGLSDYLSGNHPPKYTGVDKSSGYSYEGEVLENKRIRKDVDDIIQRVKGLPTSRERSLSITKLQEGVMWLGMDLKRLGETNPYPSSKDDTTGTKIEPTADGLKF